MFQGAILSSSGTTSTYPININCTIALSIGIDGDISFSNNNMESNLDNSVYEASDLIFQTAVNVPRGYLITYHNIDGGDLSGFVANASLSNLNASNITSGTCVLSRLLGIVWYDAAQGFEPHLHPKTESSWVVWGGPSSPALARRVGCPLSRGL